MSAKHPDVLSLVEDIRSYLRESLLKDIDGRFESYRRSIVVRDEWCCNRMATFASEIWSAPKPNPKTPDRIGSTSFNLRGETVIYCPFCGVKL